ncbi:atp-dependent rna helicase protein [Mizugakiibacter sediminis]|uniref:DEAD-box ATP-dependent RNA helicase RhpA n=1 Tax=Mizugakiibacter sediminis TaxID=1475481 RepID=A0A0K8QMF9_9GAMM|nr:DEAD/DEAH box helicase [Mizugakiibacter sediminis]GAP65906.1 atp-dependent rna helicase protein [Mizugakiibacter sediminis]
MHFSDLGLDAGLLRTLAEEGYAAPTPIQAQAIPLVLAGRDLLAAAQTGTGKTAAFALPLLQRLAASPAAARRPRALVLVPTRELAAQVAEAMRVYGRHLALRVGEVYGGVGMQPQVERFRRGLDVVVATPGRLLDHLAQRTVDLSAIGILVLDEADRMLDMGFIRDIRKLLDALPARRQNLLFSATFSDEIRALAQGLLRDPASIEVAPRNTAAERVAQRAHPVDKMRKAALLAHLIAGGDWRQVLVFTRTKHGANRLAAQLERAGISAAAIHGNKSQGARTRALADLKAGRVRALVATDIAARGIDIDQLPHVVNYELPNVPEDYVHRIGRTGRAGAGGEAISLVSADERDYLRAIQKLLRAEIPSMPVAGFEPGSAPSPAERAAHEDDAAARRRGRRAAPAAPSKAAPRGRGSVPAARNGGAARTGSESGAPVPASRRRRRRGGRPARPS